MREVHHRQILNELLTNTLKHAFKNRSKGELSIALTKEENLARLVIQDNGSGGTLSVQTESASLGLTIISTLVEQLEGSFETVNDHGTRSTVVFPL